MSGTRILICSFLLLMLAGLPIAPLYGSPKPNLRLQPETTLIAYDPEPLGNRSPVILIHGIGPDPVRWFNWHRFLNYLEQKPELRRQFKIYLFRYPPSKGVPESALAFRQAFQQFPKNEGGNAKVRILAHSQGGLLIRDLAADPALAKTIDRIITINTPFHGTPLATPQWVNGSLRELPLYSPLRLTRGSIFKFVGRKFPYFDRDFAWDNIDGTAPSAVLTNDTPKTAQEDSLPVRIITYGSFSSATPEQRVQLMKRLSLSNPIPDEEWKFRNYFSRHYFFAVGSRIIQRLPLTQEPSAGQGYEVPLITLSDGLTPVVSSLWLGRYLPGSDSGNDSLQTSLQEMLWRTLAELKGSGTARLFPNMDHRNWMEGITRNGRPAVHDLLHENEPPKPVFQWLTDDLFGD